MKFIDSCDLIKASFSSDSKISTPAIKRMKEIVDYEKPHSSSSIACDFRILNPTNAYTSGYTGIKLNSSRVNVTSNQSRIGPGFTGGFSSY